jgi:hypothetical protein
VRSLYHSTLKLHRSFGLLSDCAFAGWTGNRTIYGKRMSFQSAFRLVHDGSFVARVNVVVRVVDCFDYRVFGHWSRITSAKETWLCNSYSLHCEYGL